MNRRKFLGILGKSALVAPFLALAPVAVVSATELEAKARLSDKLNPLALTPLSEGVPLEASVQVLTYDEQMRNRLEPKPIDGLTFIEPKWFVSPAGQPSKYDPLGLYGAVAIKYWIGDQVHGDWLKITDLSQWGEKHQNYIIQEAKQALFELSQAKVAKINPLYRLALSGETEVLQS